MEVLDTALVDNVNVVTKEGTYEVAVDTGMVNIEAVKDEVIGDKNEEGTFMLVDKLLEDWQNAVKVIGNLTN